MDTLLSLRVFAAVAELKSFTAVSERLNLSPAMTSKHVQHIEAKVGARLLNRNSRNVSVTEAGERYLESVQPLLEGLEEAEAQLTDTTIAPRGTLKVSMPVWMATPAFVRVVAAYHAENPDVILDFDLSGRKINLVEEGVDLALRVATSLEDAVIARTLSKIKFPLVASPQFLDKHGRPKTVEDLVDAPFLVYSNAVVNGRIRFGKGQEAVDINVKPVLQTGNETLIHLGAREGMGFAIMPHWLSIEDLDAGRLELLLPEEKWPEVPLYAIYPDRSYMPAKLRSFLDFLAGPKGVGAQL